MSVAREVISQLAGDQRWYSIGALSVKIKLDMVLKLLHGGKMVK
jgi:hypothetical protein